MGIPMCSTRNLQSTLRSKFRQRAEPNKSKQNHKSWQPSFKIHGVSQSLSQSLSFVHPSLLVFFCIPITALLINKAYQKKNKN